MKKHLICLIVLVCVGFALNAQSLTFGGSLGGGFKPLTPLAQSLTFDSSLGSGFKPLTPLVPLNPPSPNNSGSGKSAAKGQLDVMIGYASALALNTYEEHSHKANISASHMFNMGLRYTASNRLYLAIAGGAGWGYYVTAGFGYKLIRSQKFDASLGISFGGIWIMIEETEYNYYSTTITHSYGMDLLIAANINLMLKPVEKFGIYAEFDIGGGIGTFSFLPKVGMALVL